MSDLILPDHMQKNDEADLQKASEIEDFHGRAQAMAWAMFLKMHPKLQLKKMESERGKVKTIFAECFGLFLAVMGHEQAQMMDEEQTK